MIKLKSLYFMLFMGFLSCKTSEKKTLNGADTTAVFQLILNNKVFVKENLRKSSDTLYFLKTKYFNKSWPQKSNYFNVVFIENTPQAIMVNFGPNSPYDSRKRISVLKFDMNKDTLRTLLLSHGDQIYFDCSLKLVKNKWKILKAETDLGGRRAYYGFEKDQWYLDLEKKMRKNNKYDSFKP